MQSKTRIAQIKKAIEETTSDFDKEKLQERLAKLAGGVAVIRVGAATETEMKEAKLRMEDLPSIRSASALRTSFSAAVRPSTVTPPRSAPRSLRSCTCPRSPMLPTFGRTATP